MNVNHTSTLLGSKAMNWKSDILLIKDYTIYMHRVVPNLTEQGNNLYATNDMEKG